MRDKMYAFFLFCAIVIVALFSIYLSDVFAFSSLIFAVVLGMLFANIFMIEIPAKYGYVTHFCTKEILRFGIVLYGFRLTFQDIAAVGTKGIVSGSFMLISTFLVGCFIGIKVLKLDKQLVFLISAGSSICGAAAVLATQGVLKNSSYKSAVALSTVVLFGTIAMFLYPYLYSIGFYDISSSDMAVYIGATLHEVAHVVAAANSIGEGEIPAIAVVVKMIRVMMIAPFLLVLSYYLQRQDCDDKGGIIIPWFAIFFIFVAIFNSFDLLPMSVVENINSFDTFLLCMAMFALGLNTKINSFKKVGFKPLILALVLFL